MPIFIKAKPGEKVDKLIARFKQATKNEMAEFKARQYFISETEKKQEALKKKRLKIKELERKQKLGII